MTRSETFHYIKHLGFHGKAAEASRVYIDQRGDQELGFEDVCRAYFFGAKWRDTGKLCQCATCRADRKESNDDPSRT